MASGCKLGNWIREGSQQISFSTILFNKVTAVNQTKQNPWVFKSLWPLYILRKCKVIHFVVGFLRVVTKDWKLLWSLPPQSSLPYQQKGESALIVSLSRELWRVLWHVFWGHFPFLSITCWNQWILTFMTPLNFLSWITESLALCDLSILAPWPGKTRTPTNSPCYSITSDKFDF